MEIEKIYIDSRDRITGSSSNFKIKLPRICKINNSSYISIDNVNIPYVINTIDEGHNKLYIRQTDMIGGIEATLNFTLTLTTGYYSGASLVNEININILLTPNLNLICEFKSNTNSILFKSTSERHLLSFKIDKDLPDGHGSINYIIHNATYKFIDNITGWNTGFLDLHKVKNIYIHSNILTNSNVITSHGDSNVIMKCAINCPYGNQILYNSATGDWLPCLSIPDLCEIDFYITDGKGVEINMHNMEWSFSIIFKK